MTGSLPLWVILVVIGTPLATRAEGQKSVRHVEPLSTTYLLCDYAQVAGQLDYNSTYHWITKWSDANDCATWHVVVPEPGDYRLEITYSCAPGSAGSEFEVSAGDSTVTGTVGETTGWLDGWRNFERVPVNGILRLHPGTSTITLRVTKRPLLATDAMSFHALELIPLSQEAKAAMAAADARARAMRGKTDWFVKAGYGLMFHWTTRTCPQRGSAKAFPDAVRDFDVNAFAKMAEETGAGYVMFFSSHADQFWPAPIRAVENILPGRTCTRDLIAELADALGARGIKLMLYYIPSDIFKSNEAQFYDAFESILTEVGERYGNKLAGYWFDFGQPTAPFERLARAAKAGNPDRIITWQSWVYPKLTEFQDYYGAEYGGSLIIPPDGYFDEGGPNAGLLGHATVFIDDPWIHDQPNVDIAPPIFTGSQLTDYVKRCMEKGIVVTLNPGIYQDGTISPATLDVLKALQQEIRRR
ncbi:MAG: alpha-L-fucosidase [Planctomycetaceae bacterium]